jgi:Phosphatidylethanolamine-binding protein
MLRPLVHSIVPSGELEEGELSNHVQTGRNSYLRHGYLPPDPPRGHGVHRYAFQVFAFKEAPVDPTKMSRRTLMAWMKDKVLAKGCLIGTYERPSSSGDPGKAETVRPLSEIQCKLKGSRRFVELQRKMVHHPRSPRSIFLRLLPTSFTARLTAFLTCEFSWPPRGPRASARLPTRARSCSRPRVCFRFFAPRVPPFKSVSR